MKNTKKNLRIVSKIIDFALYCAPEMLDQETVKKYKEIKKWFDIYRKKVNET